MNTFERYLNQSPSIFFKWKNKAGWPVVYVTQNIEEILGYKAEDFLTQKLFYDQIIHKEDLSKVIEEVLEGSKKKEESFKHEPYRLYKANGEIIWVSDITRISRDKNGEIDYYYGYISNITELIDYEHKLEHSLLEIKEQSNNLYQYQHALDESYIVSITDPDGFITHVNDNFIKISGYSKKELLGANHNIVRSPLTPDATFVELWQTINAKEIWRGTVANLSKNNRTYYVNVTIVPILNSNGSIKEFMSIRYDITSMIHQQQKLKELSQTSHLTETKNLSAFNETIQKYSDASLALININRFNNLNNLYGYGVGDRVILKLAEYLESSLQETSLELFHIHVDEFAVLNTSMEFEDFVQKMYEIQEFINANRIEINTKQMPLNVTVALSNEAIQDLMTSCSMAMHQAKESRQKFKIFLHDTQITAQYQSNIEWTMRIQEAIKENLVIPFYQPIYETKTGEIKKYEALIRIKNEEEYARPCYFLDIAKKSNLYLDLSLCMLKKVFETIKTSPHTFSINLTYEDIENDQMREYIYTQLQKPDIAKRVIIEIVESEKLHNMNIANEFIHAIKRYGAQISIDDFGSGYSNFEYLLRLDADYIKIDGSLIKEIDKNIDSEDIVKTIVSFAKKKNIKTVAEFVSSKEIYEKIKKIDIDYMQGFYIGKPNSTLEILK